MDNGRQMKQRWLDSNIDTIEQKVEMLEAKIGELEALVQQNSLSRLDVQLDLIRSQVAKLAAIPVPIPEEVTPPSPKYEDGGPTFMPDGNCAHTGTNVRKTLEFQPGTGTHRGELQMVNIDGLNASDKAIVYMSLDSSGNGELTWLKADTDYKVLQRKADDTLAFDWVRAHG